jgi:enoyl-CoA hydratase/carnithine racemase
MLRRTFLARALVETTFSDLGGGAKIATLTLNHPVSLNAMTVGMGEQFGDAVAALKANPDGVRAVVVTGAGRAFSAGGDMNFLMARISDTPAGNVAAMRAFYSRFLCLRELPVPVIAGINGHAIGAGLCVALACDFRVVADSARLGVNFVRLGIHPGMGATYTLPRLVGTAAASRLILTGDKIGAPEALRLGIATEVCPAADVNKVAMALATNVATASSVAVRESVATLRGDPAELSAALQREAEAQAVCYAQGDDLREAINAMKGKREPKFF